jgi:hypothetical protein
MKNELFSILIVLIIYWYFNIRKQDYIKINLPIEKMTNVSIFNGLN